MNVFLALGPVSGGAFGFGIGVALGLVHFASLKRVTTLYTSGDAAKAVALQLARLALLALAMVGLAVIGAAPLLAGALGIVIARAVVLRRTRKEP